MRRHQGSWFLKKTPALIPGVHELVKNTMPEPEITPHPWKSETGMKLGNWLQLGNERGPAVGEGER